MRTGEKLIPKATLLRALHEIMDMARDPEKFAADHGAKAITPDELRAFALGWIAGAAQGALGAEPPTTGWLARAAKVAERQS